tara:strand:- start:655 stop:1230 length:576 start_codon:yes stop_codon:yes gene_type:complete
MSDTPKNTETDSEKIDAPEMTRRGAKFLGALNKLSAEEKEQRIARWQEDRERARTQHQQIKVIKVEDGEDGEIRALRRNAAEADETGRRDIVTVNRTLLRTFISKKEWKDVSPRISHYHEQLDDITAQLKKEGKRCTGCALNPYKAKIAEQLGQDLRDPEIIGDEELKRIKEKLNVNSLQVGVENGQVVIR